MYAFTKKNEVPDIFTVKETTLHGLTADTASDSTVRYLAKHMYVQYLLLIVMVSNYDQLLNRGWSSSFITLCSQIRFKNMKDLLFAKCT